MATAGYSLHGKAGRGVKLSIQCQDVHMDHRAFSGVSEVKNNVDISTAATTIS
jgi:hypothetical protein